MRRFVRPSLRWGFILSVCLSQNRHSVTYSETLVPGQLAAMSASVPPPAPPSVAPLDPVDWVLLGQVLGAM